MPLAVLLASPAGSPYLEALARAGLDTQSAINIQQAVAACGRTPPDLIVALEGPSIDAVDACQELRASVGGGACVVVLVGPGDDEGRHLSGLDAGADACLPGGVQPATVARQALALLRGRAAAQQA